MSPLPATSEPSAAPGGASVSVLFPDAAPQRLGAEPDDAVFVDLNLDQVVTAVTRWRDEYDLVPLFRTPVADPVVIAYRHEVMRDLEDRDLVDAIGRFARSMRMVRQYRTLAGQIPWRHERGIWLLEAARTYAAGVTRLRGSLQEMELRSRGLRGVRDHLDGYVDGAELTGLVADAERVAGDLAQVRYRLHLDGRRVTVAADDDDLDYGAQVEATFERFRQGPGVDRRRDPDPTGRMNDVEAEVLERVAKLHPETFGALDAFCERYAGHLDDTVLAFDREIQFYLAYRDLITPIRDAGLPFCYPEVDGPADEVEVEFGYDLALASKLAPRGEPVVGNDLTLRGPERILVVSGANQGGKTTFARMVGQLHHLAGLGCPVPARSARLRVPDRLFTHFAHEERLEDHRGRLQDDLVRVHDVLGRATAESVVVLNEIFNSTTFADAEVLGRKVLGNLQERGCLAVYVTFVDELASLGAATVSMVATVDPEDPARRTFQLVRRPADGRAFARALADKHGLTYERLVQRLTQERLTEGLEP